MGGYSWNMYDTRTGGIQTIHDSGNHVDITTEFIKAPDGESWGVRVTGVPRADAPIGQLVKTAVIFHIAMEDMKTKEYGGGTMKILDCKPSNPSIGGEGVDAACHGYDAALGRFAIRASGNERNKVLEGTSVKSIRVPEENLWQAKGMLR
jgi:mannosyl-oligosaccharide glucosidase